MQEHRLGRERIQQLLEGTQIEALTCFYGLSQFISSPTHILQNSSSCIDLILTNQSNLVIDSEAHPSLHANCHHQVTYSKLNLKIEYSPPYERLVWNYKNANSKAINKAIEGFSWEESFRGKDIDAQARLFNKTVTNICHNYIPNKYATLNDKGSPLAK